MVCFFAESIDVTRRSIDEPAECHLDFAPCDLSSPSGRGHCRLSGTSTFVASVFSRLDARAGTMSFRKIRLSPFCALNLIPNELCHHFEHDRVQKERHFLSNSLRRA
jgi:hypothetical protein